MHDKYVRRRRAVLAVLVATALILLTAYFGEAENSPLHSVQQGIVEVFTPIEEGASKVLSPIRDLSNWVSTTLRAKTENRQLEAIVARQNRLLGQAGVAVAENARLTGMLHLTSQLNLAQDGPVYANVTSYDPSVWYQSAKLDKGSSAGISLGDPVINARGLVGDISSVGANYAVVSELRAPKFAVEVQIVDPSGKGGIGTLGPTVGNPTSLQVQFLPSTAVIAPGDPLTGPGGHSRRQGLRQLQLQPARQRRHPRGVARRRPP